MRSALFIRSAAIAGAAALTTFAQTTYSVSGIPLPPVASSVSIAGINASGQVAGSWLNGSGVLSNFLYTPGIGTTNIESTDRLIAINAAAQVLLSSGLLYTPGQDIPANLAAAVAAAFPT